MRTLRDLLSHARTRAMQVAPAVEVNTAELEMLAAAATGLNPVMSSSALHAHAHERVSDATFIQFDLWFDQMCAGVPVQHLTGVQAFYGLEFEVSRDVLIPRPETEFLIAEMLAARAQQPYGLLGEIGIGSGAISLTLLHEGYAERAIASEVSLGAVQVATRNARRILGPEPERRLTMVTAPSLDADPVDVLKSALEAGSDRFDVLVSNPPYLDRAMAAAEVDPRVLAHEPHSALFVAESNDGGDPLWFYRRIAHSADQILSPNGQIWLEVSDRRARETRALFDATKWSVDVRRDLAGRERVLSARLKF